MLSIAVPDAILPPASVQSRRKYPKTNPPGGRESAGGKRDLVHPSALTFRSFPDVGRNTHRAQVRPPDGSKGGRFRQPELALCGEQSDRQTFQVLRLPWMAEVLELPGAAPVKTWKV
ncbi:hypothetical protein EKO24_009280 [Candidatus Methylobacter oryzae]|uniref:Uncharacterized protein n=1 Tax=Candidatus Methylobacter oryzae TaxID=2497749 RepID=A0ABY3CB18_9GAMM|nr:hypothetical protein EKO24_009280 [Candidatus Methylobacter oryzae]